MTSRPPLPAGTTGVLVLADGSIFPGQGLGATAHRLGELCFNTAMTGYQEVLTDPSYADQIITFTFPHIGNVGCNFEDAESDRPWTKGFVVREPVTPPSNWRSEVSLTDWAEQAGLVGLSCVDTRALTRAVRRLEAPSAAIAHHPDGVFDLDALQAEAAAWHGLNNKDVAKDVTGPQRGWDQGRWHRSNGYGRGAADGPVLLVIDYGAKRNILRNLTALGAQVTVVPATTSAEAILAQKPDGVVLSNGPGDPAATADYAVPEIKKLIEAGIPLYGICLGHQLLCLALGGRTVKMAQGHRGANHPVKDMATGKVEIVSMNHGFTVAANSLPPDVTISQISLFDGSVCAIEAEGRKILSVQQHPEASPGPQDSFPLFDKFLHMTRQAA